MKTNDLVRELLKREGKKRGVNVADMKEIVGCLADILFEKEYAVFGSLKVTGELIALGAKRAAKQKKK